VDLAAAVRARGRAAAARKGQRPIYLPVDGEAPEGRLVEGRFVEVPVYDRYALAPGSTLSGPAVIEEGEATTLLWSGDRLTVDAQHNLVVEPAVAAGVQAAGAAPRAAAPAGSDGTGPEPRGGRA
ncbi:MAG: hypothetical protein QN167_09200, partial [Armatimonadota bacterium]|nr:hypothetical protein [Armatimonadota bacterium]